MEICSPGRTCTLQRKRRPTMSNTVVPCFACRKPVELDVPESFVAAGLNSSAVFAVCFGCAAKERLASGGLLMELASEPRDAVFRLGRIAVTAGAVAELADSRQHVHEFL